APSPSPGGATRGLRRKTNLALVMSCGYPEAFLDSRLPHAASDAAKVGAALAASDFELISAADPNPAAMRGAVQGFADGLKQMGSAAVGVVYFAGHANAWDGHNYLIAAGADAMPRSPSALPEKGVPLEWIIRTLDQSHAKAVALLIDGGRHVD